MGLWHGTRAARQAPQQPPRPIAWGSAQAQASSASHQDRPGQRHRIKPPAAGCGTRGTPFRVAFRKRPCTSASATPATPRPAAPATHQGQAQGQPTTAARALRLVLRPGPENTLKPAQDTRQEQENEHQYFILRNISYLFPTCSQNVPNLFPKLFVAVSVLFTRVSRHFCFQKTPCSHVPKKNKALRHFDAAAAPCTRLHLGTKKPPRRAVWAGAAGLG